MKGMEVLRNDKASSSFNLESYLSGSGSMMPLNSGKGSPEKKSFILIQNKSKLILSN